MSKAEEKGVVYVKEKLQFGLFSSILLMHTKTHMHKHILGRASQRKGEKCGLANSQ